MSASVGRHWTLDPSVIFLNHGSFGACPRPVLEAQQRVRERIERQPVRFFVRELEGLLDDSRRRLAGFLGADPQDLVWVQNATTGVNAVLRSLELRAGDELLTTDHEYNACRNALEFVAARAGARVVVATVPLPLASSGAVVDAVLRQVTARTRIALIDHVTSQTGLVLPVERIAQQLRERGVPTLVDGAHAPGMLALDLGRLDVDYYTGNCHKWLCAPKGAGFLWVRRELQETVHPVVISHGANSARTDRSRYWLEFDWVGTGDPSPMLTVPDALEFMGSLLPGGWPELRARNRELALAGRRVLAQALEQPPCYPDEMVGSLASVPLPPGSDVQPLSALYTDPLQETLLDRFGIEVPVIPWPATPARRLRISAQVYNDIGQYEALAGALRQLLGSRGV